MRTQIRVKMSECEYDEYREFLKNRDSFINVNESDVVDFLEKQGFKRRGLTVSEELEFKKENLKIFLRSEWVK